MKILFVNNGIVADDPGPSGGETRFIEIAKNWAQAGHEIHLLSSEGGKRLCNRFGLAVRLHSLPTPPAGGRFAHIFRLFQAMLSLPKSVFEEKFDLVYSTNELSYDVIPAFLIKRRFPHVRWAVAVHWLPPFPPWRRTASTLWNSTAFFITERLGLFFARRYADILLPVSEMTGKQLEEAKVSRDRYVPVECGVVFDKIQAVVNTVKGRSVDAIFMKRIQAVKGVFDLIEIWQRVVKIKPDASLMVVGDGLDLKKIKRLTKERGLERNIEYPGVIYDFDEKFRVLAGARLFLLPSHEENWAIVIGEALASGTPVITYDLKELQSVWGESCVYIKKYDVESFAKQVLHLLDHKEELAEKREIGLRFVQRYDWKIIAEREIALIPSPNQKPSHKY